MTEVVLRPFETRDIADLVRIWNGMFADDGIDECAGFTVTGREISYRRPLG